LTRTLSPSITEAWFFFFNEVVKKPKWLRRNLEARNSKQLNLQNYEIGISPWMNFPPRSKPSNSK
jgi:hypothetical protein